MNSIKILFGVAYNMIYF